MTALADRINADLKDAMRAQDKARVSTLRLVNAAIKDKTMRRAAARTSLIRRPPRLW
jgi:uncharacterized protein YqeY